MFWRFLLKNILVTVSKKLPGCIWINRQGAKHSQIFGYKWAYVFLSVQNVLGVQYKVLKYYRSTYNDT